MFPLMNGKADDEEKAPVPSPVSPFRSTATRYLANVYFGDMDIKVSA